VKAFFSRFAEMALSATSLLAKEYEKGGKRFSSLEIAERRGLSQAFMAKVLTILAQEGIVEGVRGAAGGYRLARPPGEISLHEVIRPFQAEHDEFLCPFGPEYCGTGPHCPLHDHIVRMRAANETFLQSTTLEAFQKENGP